MSTYLPQIQNVSQYSRGGSLVPMSDSSNRHPDTCTVQAYPYDTMDAGAHNMYAAYQLIINVGTDPLSRRFGIEDSVLGRIGKLAMINLPTAAASVTLQHEVFGHGARYREFGFNTTYRINGWDNRTLPHGAKNISLEDNILAAIGGTEATQLMANSIAQKMLDSGGRYYDALPYIFARLDISKYILNDSDPSSFGTPLDNIESCNDVENYWNLMTLRRGNDLTARYGLETVARDGLWDGPGFSYDALRWGAVWNLIDPTMWYSAYKLCRYVVKGEEKFSIPNFLPRTGFVMSPLGPEYYISVPFRFKSIVFDPYVRMALMKDDNSYGGGIDVLNIKLGKRITMGPGIDIWSQEGQTGFMVEDTFFFKVMKNFELGAGASYKTEGYVVGEPLQEGYGITGSVRVKM